MAGLGQLDVDVAGVSKSAAIVLNDHSKVVFLRNHS